MDQKTCSHCHRPGTFEKNHIQCTGCQERNKAYYLKNKETLNAKGRAYYAANVEYFREYDKQRDKDPKRKAQRKVWKKETQARKRRDPLYRLKKSCSTAVYDILLERKNRVSITKCLPYSLQELKQHLESLFEPWMNWNNYGRYSAKTWKDDDSSTWTWQIDHIIPHSMFKYASMEDEEFKKCWALSNLRPLSSKQNTLDGVHQTRHH